MARAPAPPQLLRELIDDAADRPDRLTPWEREFMASMRTKLDRELNALSLSQRQDETLRIIERKVYAVG